MFEKASWESRFHCILTCPPVYQEAICYFFRPNRFLKWLEGIFMFISLIHNIKCRMSKPGCSAYKASSNNESISAMIEAIVIEAKIFTISIIFSFFVGFRETEIYSREFSSEGQMES